MNEMASKSITFNILTASYHGNSKRMNYLRKLNWSSQIQLKSSQNQIRFNYIPTNSTKTMRDSLKDTTQYTDQIPNQYIRGRAIPVRGRGHRNIANVQ